MSVCLLSPSDGADAGPAAASVRGRQLMSVCLLSPSDGADAGPAAASVREITENVSVSLSPQMAPTQGQLPRLCRRETTDNVSVSLVSSDGADAGPAAASVREITENVCVSLVSVRWRRRRASCRACRRETADNVSCLRQMAPTQGQLPRLSEALRQFTDVSHRRSAPPPEGAAATESVLARRLRQRAEQQKRYV